MTTAASQAAATSSAPRILVVKLGALGDFVLSLAACQAIRRSHEDARITLLTTAPCRAVAEASGCFDEVWLDERPKPWQIGAWLRLRARLRGGGFVRVYDLQRNARSAAYFRFFAAPKPEWVGTAAGASHRFIEPAGERLHYLERERRQLAAAGVAVPAPPDLSFLDASLARFALPPRYALLIPGGSTHLPEKRWPAERYAALGRHLAERGITPLLIGTAAEATALAEIAEGCPAARNLCQQTSLADVAALARGAVGAVGNVTGPTHLVAACGCPSLALFSNESDPRKMRPCGPRVAVLSRPDLADLAVDEVCAAFDTLP